MSEESSAYYIAKLAEKDRSAAASPWIAVADRLPPDSLPVLVVFARTGMNPRVADYDEIFGWTISGGRAQLIPTHWMPIPPLPEKKEAA